VWRPPGFVWAVREDPAVSVVLIAGVAGAAYGVVVLYTHLTGAWNAWSGR